MRASLEKSLDIKKDARWSRFDQCEELGASDADVADSLEHLPASPLSARRAARNQGERARPRSQYNITTLNNRILATDDDSRDLAFDVLPRRSSREPMC